VLTLVHAGGSHIDHAEMLRSGSTGSVLGHRVMAPSTLGTFLRAFTFGHVRQLDRVLGEALRRAWALGAGPGPEQLVIDLDSIICEVSGKAKHGASYGYTKKLGYHPLVAFRAWAGESVWIPIEYTADGEAEVAECDYKGRRLIVRRPGWSVARPRCGRSGGTSPS
jgi:hypothetical protein